MNKTQEYNMIFTKCPGCGSERRYFEEILKDLQEADIIDKQVECFDFQLQQGIAVSQEKITSLPFGTELPAFKRIWDTCCECGMVYSTRLERTIARKSIEQAPRMPNRAERRRGIGDRLILPGINN